MKPCRKRPAPQRAANAVRTLFICLAVMCVPIAACLMVYFTYSIRTMEREINRNMQMTVEQGKNNLDYRMAQVEKNARAILSTIYPYLNSDVDLRGQLTEYNEMLRVLSEYNNQNMISKLRLYVPGSKQYSRQGDIFYSLATLEEDEGVPLTSGTRWQTPHQIVPQFDSPPVWVLSCVSVITGARDVNTIVGALFLDMDIAQLKDVLCAGVAQDEALFIVDSQGVVLAHADISRLGESMLSPDILASGAAGSGSATISGQNCLMVYTRLQAADWYLVMTVPRVEIYSPGVYSLDIVQFLLILLIAGILFTALAITWRMVVRDSVLRINGAISATIRDMQRGGLELLRHEAAPSDDRRPLAALEHNTNLMAVTINRLLEARYKDQLAVRDLQMRTLQAQINPHFLYNTLDVIKWMIADHQNDESIWMINALSRYFQLSLSSGRDIVCIREEIRLTQTYIGIMQKRFKGVFEAGFDVEESAADCLIPKLSLQPIVENALLHGILYSEKPEKHLSIRVSRDSEGICVEVEDNGAGMEESTRAAIAQGDTPGGSYGISNVVRRLRLFGADENAFEIYSRKEIGTCVTLRFPAKESAKENA